MSIIQYKCVGMHKGMPGSLLVKALRAAALSITFSCRIRISSTLRETTCSQAYSFSGLMFCSNSVHRFRRRSAHSYPTNRPKVRNGRDLYFHISSASSYLLSLCLPFPLIIHLLLLFPLTPLTKYLYFHLLIILFPLLFCPFPLFHSNFPSQFLFHLLIPTPIHWLLLPPSPYNASASILHS